MRTRTALRRGVPCHVRKEGELCAQPDTTMQDLHGHGCQGGCGGRLHGICGSVVDDDNENHRICSACVAKAGKRKAPAADSAGRAQSRRPKATNGGSKKEWLFDFLRCAAWRACRFFFSFLRHRSRCARPKGERICPDVVRAGVTGVVAVCFLVVFGALFFGVIFFFIFILQHRRWQRGVGFSFVRTRVLQAGCSFTTFSGA